MGLFDSPTHVIILLIVVLLLFGSTRLPGAAKALGSSMHLFKKAVQGQDDESQPADTVKVTPVGALPPSEQHQQQSAVPSGHGDTQQQLQDLERQLQELKNRQN